MMSPYMTKQIVCLALACIWVFAWTYHLKTILPPGKPFEKRLSRFLLSVFLGVLGIVLDIWLEGFCFLCVLSAKRLVDNCVLKIEHNWLKWLVSTIVGIVVYLAIAKIVQLLWANS